MHLLTTRDALQKAHMDREALPKLPVRGALLAYGQDGQRVVLLGLDSDAAARVVLGPQALDEQVLEFVEAFDVGPELRGHPRCEIMGRDCERKLVPRLGVFDCEPDLRAAGRAVDADAVHPTQGQVKHAARRRLTFPVDRALHGIQSVLS